MVMKSILPAVCHCVDTLHGSRREIRKGKQTIYFAQQYDVASELAEVTGNWARNVTDVASEFGGECLGNEWVNVAQNSTVWRSKLEEMIHWKNKKWLIARVLKSSDLDMPCLHKDFVSEAPRKSMCVRMTVDNMKWQK